MVNGSLVASSRSEGGFGMQGIVLDLDTLKNPQMSSLDRLQFILDSLSASASHVFLPF